VLHDLAAGVEVQRRWRGERAQHGEGMVDREVGDAQAGPGIA